MFLSTEGSPPVIESRSPFKNLAVIDMLPRLNNLLYCLLMSACSSAVTLKAVFAVAITAGVAWTGWVYHETQPRQLVNRSAVRNYKAAVAEKTPEKAQAAKHNSTGSYVAWKQLDADQQALLSPLEKRWNYLSINQRKSLLEAAKRYASMSAEQKIDFGTRLVQWSQLTGKQRREIREHHKLLASLPPDRRAHVKENWLAEHEESTTRTNYSNP